MTINEIKQTNKQTALNLRIGDKEPLKDKTNKTIIYTHVEERYKSMNVLITLESINRTTI